MKSSILILFIFVLAFAGTARSQDMKFAGTHKPEKEVLELIAKYRAASTNWKTPQERDEKRKALVSSGYFYHGWDGMPIGFDGLTARQTKNDLRVSEVIPTDVVLFQYENSAIVTFISVSKGVNHGKPFENRASQLIIISKENGAWKVTADVIGQEPDAPAPAPAATTKN
jgi:hypothetical protein